MKAAAETLDSIVIKRPRPLKYIILQHLCLDKGYDFPEIELEVVVKRKYVPHIRHKGEKTKRKKKIRYNKRRRRWVVERTNSWHNTRFRKLLVRYEKKSENYLGLVQLACCIIIYRRLILG